MNTDEHRCGTATEQARSMRGVRGSASAMDRRHPDRGPRAANRRPGSLGALLLLGLGLTLPACAGGYDTQTALRNALDEFHDGFRWAAMGSMLPHIPADQQDTFAAEYEASMDGVQIADYEVDRIVIADGNEEADVWVTFTWFRDAEMLVHEVTVREHWKADGMRWDRAEVAVERGELP